MSANGMDRPCSRPTSEHACGAVRRRSHAMPRKFDTAVVTIGIDPGKNILHLVGLDARGEIVPREKVARTKIVSLARECAAMPDRDRGRHGNALCDPRTACPRPRRETSAAGLRQAFPADPQE